MTLDNLKQDTHGTRSCYQKSGCRCEPCKNAASIYAKTYKINNPQFEDHGREYARQYYWDHRDVELEQTRSAREERRDLIQEIKIASGCVDCGWNDHPAALDFDHKTGAKAFEVGSVGTRNIEAIKEEASKCEVVCARCHRIRTYHRLKFGQAVNRLGVQLYDS